MALIEAFALKIGLIWHIFPGSFANRWPYRLSLKGCNSTWELPACFSTKESILPVIHFLSFLWPYTDYLNLNSWATKYERSIYVLSSGILAGCEKICFLNNLLPLKQTSLILFSFSLEFVHIATWNWQTAFLKTCPVTPTLN